MIINLSERLLAAASLVKGGGILADIGTDHGYLPIHLIQSGKIVKAIAADIGKMPLENARKSVVQYELADKIELRLSDGLNSFRENEVDEIVFAGMGGTLIAEKLKETPWIKNKKLHFVFQPQSRAEELSQFLFENGFQIHIRSDYYGKQALQNQTARNNPPVPSAPEPIRSLQCPVTVFLSSSNC